MIKRLMLDTNVYDWLAKNAPDLSPFGLCIVFVTHVQLDELMRTPDDGHRSNLQALFDKISPTQLPTRTAIWDDSVWGATAWSADDGLFDRMLRRLKELDGAKSNRRDRAQTRDVRIAETSIQEACTLVTNDKNLRTVTAEFGGVAQGLSEFLAPGFKITP